MSAFKSSVPLLLAFLLIPLLATSQRKKKQSSPPPTRDLSEVYAGLQWRNIGPFRGGRSVASAGVVGDPLTYYMGGTGSGIWKTTDAGTSWKNISDGQLATGTVGALAVSESDPNVIYVGMGEHAVRGVMTSSGDGIYKSTDAGKTWKHTGLPSSMHISDVIIHPNNPDIVYVAVQGALYGASPNRGVYRTMDGGETWNKVLFVADGVGASSLSMDMTNPRILYAAMWQHRRYPWTMESGGEQSGLYKSTDSGDSWEKMEEGLPENFGKSGISVSRANPERVFAIIEAEGKQGGLYRSDDAGKKWTQINKNRVLVARSWYYMEVFADPQDENKVFVLNAPVMQSIDGGRSFSPVPTPHGDNHHLWINPNNNDIMINSNDGGANVSLNGGKTWSSQRNQPTAQFYRVITDNQVPYHIYGGQQDNSAIGIASRTNTQGITWKDWYSVSGCESAYLAFDPDNPAYVFGGCYQGIISYWDRSDNTRKQVKEYPELGLSGIPKNFKYRYNWNAPIIASPHDPGTIYHVGNVVFKTQNQGVDWEVVSPDLTRNDSTRQGPGGGPFTNEAAGGENYNTIMYLVESPHEEGVLWAGSDDGLIHLTRDGGTTWSNVTPAGMQEGIVNSIEVSPHDPATTFVTLMRYKFNDLRPYAYRTSDYGATWTKITNGFDDPNGFPRVIREDQQVKGLLYAGTETGLYLSFDNGDRWEKMQLNLPVLPINDLTLRQNDLIAATAGRSFWVLDDLSAIQQSRGAADALTLFTPKDTYYFIGGSSENSLIGKNPKSGVTFDYYLPEELPDSSLLKVEVLEAGQVIRSYSSQKQDKFKTWPGGPPKPEVLPSKEGVNRFTWDFRRDQLPAVDRVFAFGDYRGGLVSPGNYDLRMILEGDTLESPIKILPNPNSNASSADFQAKDQAVANITEMIKEIHESVNDMRSAKKQVNSFKGLLEGRDGLEALLDTAKALSQKISDWEENLIQPKQETFQDVINFQNQLNAQLMHLKGFIDNPDHPKVTSGAKERLSDLTAQWEVFQSQRTQLIDVELKAFNDLYQQLDLPAVILPEQD